MALTLPEPLCGEVGPVELRYLSVLHAGEDGLALFLPCCVSDVVLIVGGLLGGLFTSS